MLNNRQSNTPVTLHIPPKRIRSCLILCGWIRFILPHGRSPTREIEKKNDMTRVCVRGEVEVQCALTLLNVQCGSHDTVRNDLHTYIDVKQSIFFMRDTRDSTREPRKSTGTQVFIQLKGLWSTKISYDYPLLPRRERSFLRLDGGEK
jgi:hypothetical protein